VNQWDDDMPDEGPLESDLDELGDDGPETAPCPACGAEIYDDSPRCPVCGEYVLTSVSYSPGPVPLWVLLAAVAAIAAFLFYILL